MKTDILVINPGSTTTKVGLYREGKIVLELKIAHDPDKLLAYNSIPAQLPYRLEIIDKFLKENGVDKSRLKAVVGRGGMIVSLCGGGYLVNDQLCKALQNPAIPQHACNLGAIIAEAFAEPLGIPAYIYDSPMGCELSPVAKISGLEEIERYGCYHVLNGRAQAINYSKEINIPYKDLNLIVCHMGGGISVMAHDHGKIVDGLSYDDGPMAPERTGGIALIQWTDLCFSGKYTQSQMLKLIGGKGGLYSYLGTTDCQEVEKIINEGGEKSQKAKVVYEALAYQVAKGIAQMSAALKGKVDGVILTGGAAHSKLLTSMIEEYAGHIGKFIIMAGEDELLALAKGAERILSEEEEAHIFQSF